MDSTKFERLTFKLEDPSQAILDLITHVPRERIWYFQMKGAPTQLPHPMVLAIVRFHPEDAFPNVILSMNQINFPSLRRISLDRCSR